ncbi:DUF6122 family protein [Mangrovimonas futianensis]|uniref:DUF6122 family protein n=1 Tax=Mangrovimonas futianensis TaxID=2895523 RepID=UPI001E2929ED|nr:DUF6122 family protein [Mangrovimonas futianensis]MCF1422226.1 DUF6122 family protein [Mangrovimonas futianensis]
MQGFIHYGCHFLIPLFVAFFGFRAHWIKAYFIMIAAFLVDLDHLLATPIFDPNRCSINFHPLHTYWAIAVYFLMLIPKKARLVALGLIIHMLSDGVDCLLSQF